METVQFIHNKLSVALQLRTSTKPLSEIQNEKEIQIF